MKTHSCIDIVRTRCQVSYINFLLNMSHSNINKSVITIRRGHVMISVFVNLGILSCAVDAFLKISFLPYLSSLRIRTRNDFTDLLFNVCSHYISSSANRSLFRETREPVWSYITGKHRAQEIDRGTALQTSQNEEADRISFILTYLPQNLAIQSVILKNFKILRNDPNTYFLYHHSFHSNATKT